LIAISQCVLHKILLINKPSKKIMNNNKTIKKKK